MFEELLQDSEKCMWCHIPLLSQYRNKKMFWLLQQFWAEKQIELKWIYLESEHGKDIPDVIWATINTTIKYLLVYHPNSTVYTIQQLKENYIQEQVLSMKLRSSYTEDVKKLYASLPTIKSVAGTMKIHENPWCHYLVW